MPGGGMYGNGMGWQQERSNCCIYIGIAVFVIIILITCLGVFFWLQWRNQEKSKSKSVAKVESGKSSTESAKDTSQKSSKANKFESSKDEDRKRSDKNQRAGGVSSSLWKTEESVRKWMLGLLGYPAERPARTEGLNPLQSLLYSPFWGSVVPIGTGLVTGGYLVWWIYRWWSPLSSAQVTVAQYTGHS